VAATEQRVSYLEAKVEEVSSDIADLRVAIAALDVKMDRRFDRVESRFYWLLGLLFTLLVATIAGFVQIITKLM
jgi:hypothetical protein